jgi:hypothetical protein
MDLSKVPEVIEPLKKRKGGHPTKIQQRRKGTARGFVKGNPSYYTDDEKIAAVAAYAAAGTCTRASEVTGIPDYRIRRWKMEPWWEELIQRVRMEKDEELDAKMSKIIDKALEELQDRVNDGDYRMNPNGQLKRVPITAKDAVTVTKQIIDKRQLLRGRPTSISGSVTTTQHLKNLAEEFKKFANAKEIVIEKDDGFTRESIESIDPQDGAERQDSTPETPTVGEIAA